MEVGDNCKNELDNKDEINDSKIDGNKIKDKKIKNNKFVKKKNYQRISKSKKTVGFSNFFTTGTRLVFTKLRQVFVKVLILYYFDPKRHIQIKTYDSSYAIGRVFS